MLTSLETQDDNKNQKCNGMYKKGSWGGTVDPFILTKFDNSSFKGDKDAVVSFVIFEWRDEGLLGVLSKDPKEAGLVRASTF